MKPVPLAPCAIDVPLRKYWFQTVSTSVPAPLDRLCRRAPPPATSCQIVAGSSAIANATTLSKVASITAEFSVLSEVPPTITPKGLALLVPTLVRPLPYWSPDPPSPLSEKTEMLRSAASMNSSRAAKAKGEFGATCGVKPKEDVMTSGLCVVSQKAD